MATWICKFGGSSLADIAKIQAVAKQVVDFQQQNHRLVVVVSAMGNTTDTLLAQARSITENPPQRELDMLLTAGERISMALFSMAIHAQGGRSTSLTGSQSGIITEDKHQGARILEIRPARIEEALAQGDIAIVAGYQGVSIKREITTLGRGGSDLTAVALAGALHADRCMIFSDVDGVYTADPRDCPNAQHMPEIDYDFMLAMAQAGAKVLNARAVETARSSSISVEAYKTGDTSARHTVLSPKVKTRLWAIVGHRQIMLSDDTRWPQIGVGNNGRYVDMTDANTRDIQERQGLVTPLGANAPLNLLAKHLVDEGIHIVDTIDATFGKGFVLNRNDVAKGVCLLHNRLEAHVP